MNVTQIPHGQGLEEAIGEILPSQIQDPYKNGGKLSIDFSSLETAEADCRVVGGALGWESNPGVLG